MSLTAGALHPPLNPPNGQSPPRSSTPLSEWSGSSDWSGSSAWSGSSCSNYTPSEDDFDCCSLDSNAPDHPYFDFRSAARDESDEPVALHLREPAPEVVNLADMPDSDEEEEDWGSVDDIDDGPGRAAARRLGRKTCRQLLGGRGHWS